MIKFGEPKRNTLRYSGEIDAVVPEDHPQAAPPPPKEALPPPAPALTESIAPTTPKSPAPAPPAAESPSPSEPPTTPSPADLAPRTAETPNDDDGPTVSISQTEDHEDLFDEDEEAKPEPSAPPIATTEPPKKASKRPSKKP